MCATFTDEDVGKLVERTDGRVIGTVASLEDGAARVEPAPDVIDKLLIRFDRAEVGNPFMLDESDVREISAKRVHLTNDFSRERAEPASASGSGAAAENQTEAGESAGSAHSNRANGGAGATADSAADSSGALRPETRFQTGAAAVSGISALLGLLFFWFGYQDSSLLVVGPDLDIISGAVGFMFFVFVAVVALVMAIYMQPGLDD